MRQAAPSALGNQAKGVCPPGLVWGMVVSPPTGPGLLTNPPATDKSTPEACVGKTGICKVNRRRAQRAGTGFRPSSNPNDHKTPPPLARNPDPGHDGKNRALP